MGVEAAESPNMSEILIKHEPEEDDNDVLESFKEEQTSLKRKNTSHEITTRYMRVTK